MNYEEKTQKYSTWGDKLLQHADVLHSIQIDKKFKPITVQLAPTEACDSDCPFCSVAKRPLKSYLPFRKIKFLLQQFKVLGAKSLEITGGGNPLLYRDKEEKKDINDVIEFAGQLGYDIGIITNTEKLERHLNPKVYNYINWIRISMIKLDEGKNPEDYDFGSFPRDKMGLSYIIYEGTNGVPDACSRTQKPYAGTTKESIEKIAKVVELNPELKFCRIGGNCLTDNHQLIARQTFGDVIRSLDVYNKFFIKEVYDNDRPYDSGCYVGMVRPYIAPSPDGGDYQVYVCTSHVLEDRIYKLDFSLGSIDNILDIWAKANRKYKTDGYPYEVRNNKGKNWCESCHAKCFYYNNNKILHTVAQRMDENDVNFA